MKKSKILSLVTALALSVSMLPSAANAANSGVIWEETFNGGLSGYNVTNCEITDGVLKNATATGSRNDGGFNFETLNAKAEGKIRFKYDVKTDNGNDVSKSEIKTNGANIPLLYYWYGGIREVTDHDAGTGAEYGYEWYTNDIVMDFDAGKITVNVTKTETGEVVLSNYVINNDFAGITTIKGVDIWGWDSDRSQEKYYDNFLMEYVDPYLIYSEDYNEDVKFQHTAGTAPTVVNGVVQTAASGESGFSFDTLNAAVADAPLGKIRVRFDFNSPDPGLAATKMTLKTNSGNITFLSYGVYGAIRDDALSDATGNPGFTPNVWHDNDIVFDFENNKIIYTVTNKKTGAKVLDGLELSKDLSGVTHVKGFDLFGYAGTTHFDNLLIEYVKEEAVPADKNLIYSENYDRNINFQYTAGTAPTVEDGVIKTAASGESGFSFDFLNASVVDGLSGKVRVKFDFKSHDPGLAATKMTLKTNARNITFLSYGVYGAIRDDATSDATGNPGFAPNKWHENDIVFDFANNKVIYTVTNKETGAKLLDGFELSKDLSGITHVKGFDLFGYAGTTYFDNLVIEYVEEEAPEIPDIMIEEVNMGEYAGKAWDVTLNKFDSTKTYAVTFTDENETKTGEIGFENVETEGSLAFAILLHTQRAKVVMQIVAE